MSYTGLAQNEAGWWYIKDGFLDWSYTGIVTDENGTWYVQGGMFDWTYTGKATVDGIEYDIVNGRSSNEKYKSISSKTTDSHSVCSYDVCYTGNVYFWKWYLL